VTASEPDVPAALTPLKWRLPALLFVATVASIIYTAASPSSPDEPFQLKRGLAFAASLLAILLTHEFAHFVFARHHRVNASLPFFIPLPLLTPFGTMGAVILMRDRVRSKNALLDIGASGPLAGMVVAVPVILYGLAHSAVKPLGPTGTLEGQSLLYLFLKRVILGPIPEGFDVELGPVAFAGWVGLFITMLNLLPVGQLDGGHVAYALFGKRQDRFSRIVRWAMLLLVPINFLWQVSPVLRGAHFHDLWMRAAIAAMPWVGWFAILTVLERMSGGGHPPTEPGDLSPTRRIVAIGTLVLFALLFMPTPWMSY
jgi:membrane-associated protease RseP (regulator of RpoE activity)